MGSLIPFELSVRPVQDRMLRPLSDLRISVMDQCNFRCPYCMPADDFPDQYPFLRRKQMLDFDEIERLASIFVSLGASKLRLTGGEPLLRRDLAQLVRRLARIDGVEDLALTSNGVLLPRHAKALHDAGLKRITISLDTLDPVTFARLSAGRGKVQQVLAGLKAAEMAGFASIKINCVVMRGINDGQVLDLLQHFRHSGHIVRLIEYMDVGTLNHWQATEVVPSMELREHIAKRWPLQPLAPNMHGEVARRYAYADGGGEIGFISSISKPFCGGCSRARLSADGHLYTCLFAERGHDLRSALRGAADRQALQAMLADLWAGRQDRYSEMRAETECAQKSEHVEMFRIGG